MSAPVSITYVRDYRVAIVIVRLHLAMILQTPGVILRLVVDDPHFEGTAALDRASLSFAFVVCDLAGVFHGACSRAYVAAEAAGGAVFGQSVASLCGPGVAEGAEFF